MDNTFFNFKLDLEPNVIDMIYDIIRMSTIQLVTQIMFYMNNSSLSLFSETFIKTFVFINISILFYYLVIRKLFSFISDDYLRVEDKKYTPTPPMTTRTSNDLQKAVPKPKPAARPVTAAASPPVIPPPTVPASPAANSPNSATNTVIPSVNT